MNRVDVPILIQKEEIAELHFPEGEVLTSIDEHSLREYELKRISSLGNNDHVKVKIIFEDTSGLKQVETTVWAVTNQTIILKKGVTIPINRIHEIKI